MRQCHDHLAIDRGRDALQRIVQAHPAAPGECDRRVIGLLNGEPLALASEPEDRGGEEVIGEITGADPTGLLDGIEDHHATAPTVAAHHHGMLAAAGQHRRTGAREQATKLVLGAETVGDGVQDRVRRMQR